MVFIGQTYRSTIETILKRIGHGGYEKLQKEMCRFVENCTFMVECVYWLLQNIPSQEQGAFHWTM